MIDRELNGLMIKLDWLGSFDSTIIDYLRTVREIGWSYLELNVKRYPFLSSTVLYLSFEWMKIRMDINVINI